MTHFCVDCKHYRGFEPTSRCESPRNEIDTTDTAFWLVTGIEQPQVKAALGMSCNVLRATDVHPVLKIRLCGYSGEWFEPKE